MIPALVAVVLLVVIVAIGLVVVRPALAKNSLRAEQDAMLRALGAELHLNVTPAEPGPTLPSAEGQLGRVDVAIRPSADGSTVKLMAQLLTRGRVCFRPRGSNVAGEKTGPPSPTGNAALDQEVEVLGANAALLTALKDAELATLVRRVVVELGGIAVGGWVEVTRPLGTSLDALRATFREVVTLARWVNEPNAPRGAHLEAPLVPPFHGMEGSGRDQAFLEHVGAAIGSGEVVCSDDCWEWRGQTDQMPTRVQVDGDDVSVQTKLATAVSNLELHWLPDKIPEPQATSEWDEDDADVFVGYGVILSQSHSIEDDGATTFQRRCAEWARIPDPVRAQIVESMAKFDVHELVIDRSGCKAEMRRSVDEMFAPRLQIQGLVSSLKEVLPELAKLPLLEAGSGSGGVLEIAPVNRDTCGYCRSVFVWTANPRCPNCGAPLEGHGG